MVLTGGPGTGKTTTVSKLLTLLFSQNSDLRVSLIAQTGKASTRLKESLDNSRKYLNLSPQLMSCFDRIKPSTIHRFLGYIKGSIDFRRNQENPIESDIVILDESSMVDLPMMAKLLNAIPEGTRVYLLGDLNQLSSVEVGSVFGDLCLSLGDSVNCFSKDQEQIIKEFYPEFMRHSEGGTTEESKTKSPSQKPNIQLSMFGDEESIEQYLDKNEISQSYLPLDDNVLIDHVVKLERSYRFSSIKGLGKFAFGLLSNSEIDESFLSEYKKEIKGEEGVRIVSTPGTEIEKQFVSQYAEFITEPDILTALDLMNKVKVLCAVKEGTRGVFEMNRSIESLLESQGLIKPHTVNYHNQPILILKNDYTVGLYNGDVGLVRENEVGRLMVYFKAENELVSYDISSLPAHQTAFAMTIHKSQGSEFEDVVLVLPEKEHKVLSKQLVYTGVTRAKKRVLILASDEVFISSVQKVEQRLSNLKERF